MKTLSILNGRKSETKIVGLTLSKDGLGTWKQRSRRFHEEAARGDERSRHSQANENSRNTSVTAGAAGAAQNMGEGEYQPLSPRPGRSLVGRRAVRRESFRFGQQHLRQTSFETASSTAANVNAKGCPWGGLKCGIERQCDGPVEVLFG